MLGGILLVIPVSLLISPHGSPTRLYKLALLYLKELYLEDSTTW